jgi:hypothetical protein
MAALAFFGGALAIVARGSRRAEDAFPRASVFNESPHGLSIAYGYLRDRAQRPQGRGAPVAILSRRIGHERLPTEAVVFRVRPGRRPTPASPQDAEDEDSQKGPREKGAERNGTEKRGEAKRIEASRRPEGPLLSPAEDEWIRGGGRLVLGIDEEYGPLRAIPSPRTTPVRKVFPIWPAVRTLVPGEAMRTLVGATASEAHAVFASGSAPVLSRLLLGKGDVLLLALPELLENESLSRGDHLRLFVALAGEGRPVFFDEWAQGLGREEGLLDVMLEWGLGPAFAFAVLACALWVWRARTRLGPADRDPAESRSEAVDLVDSLAQLYDRALTRRETAGLYREGFERDVGARTGLRGKALARRVDELLRRGAARPTGGAEIPPSEFLRALQGINEGYRRLYEHGHSRRRL